MRGGRGQARLAWGGAAALAAASCAWAGQSAWAVSCLLLGGVTLGPGRPLPAWGRTWALGAWVVLLGGAVVWGVPALSAAGALALALVARRLEAHAALVAPLERCDAAVGGRVAARALLMGTAAWGAGAAGAFFPRGEGFWGNLGWMALALLALGALARLAFGAPSPSGGR